MKSSFRRTRPEGTIDRAASANAAPSGKVLILLAVCLPLLFGLLGLVIDTGLLMGEHRELQQLADAAATAAARDLTDGIAAARATAESIIKIENDRPQATVEVNIPPTAGPYQGNANYVEVIVTQSVATSFIHVLGVDSSHAVRARATAGLEDATAGAAIVVLDPAPPAIAIGGLPPDLLDALLPVHGSLELLGGFENLGAGVLTAKTRVDGAVLVNSEWGGVDETGQPVGVNPGPPYAAAGTPLIPLSKLAARDVRVVGGVDDIDNFVPYVDGAPHPLSANRSKVPDPLAGLPTPMTSVDDSNVSGALRGGVNVLNVPLIGLPIVLQPGVYEWINVTAGPVRFAPGVYIIRGKHPLTGIPLTISGLGVTATGVMFYITDTPGYSPGVGWPDSVDGETVPPAPNPGNVIPSAVITLLIGTRISPLSDPGSPFNGITIYQRRSMRRPIVIVGQQLLGTPGISGTVYAKWAHVLMAANGTYDLRIASGSVRLVNLLNLHFTPSDLFPPARDVYLVE